MDAPPEPATADLLSRLAGHLLASGRRLVTAESCTGGWIAKLCTDLPGSSRWFLGGAVVYDNALKAGLLGVNPATLAEAGAVSGEVVREMAAGALERLGGDVAVAVSGVAGPDGGTPGKPVGTVWFAWGRRDTQGIKISTALEYFAGDRDAVRRQAVARALRGVLEQ
jgi:nicotinamide-nucleotide amidase